MSKNLIEQFDEKFKSLNDVPVTSIRLTREEWLEIRKLLSEQHGIAELEALKEKLRVTDENHGNTTVIAHKALKENDVRKQQNAELLATLVEAREMVDDWALYASAYFQEKHDLAGDLAKLDAVIAKVKGGDA